MSIPTIKVKVPHSAFDGSLIDPENFAYDMKAKQWKDKLTIAKEAIEKYTKSVITKDNLIPLGVSLLQEKNVVTHDVERANVLRQNEVEPEIIMEASEASDKTPASQADEQGEKKGRGRRSRYPYATCAIGESFQIDAGSPAITLNHSLVGNRAFQVEIKNGIFVITRTK